MILRARHLVSMADTLPAVVENGAVRSQGDTILAAGSFADVRRGAAADEPVVDYADAVLLPGFVNAHTHLELSHLAGQVPPSGTLADWLLRLVKHAMSSPPTAESVAAAVASGLGESFADGVTCVGDITRFPAWTRPVLGDAGMAGVSFGEVIAVGRRRGLLEERIEAATAPLDGATALRIGVSPHAPYTVEPAGLRRCAAVTAQHDLPLCIHVAESAEEARFTEQGDGPLADYLQKLGVWDDLVPAAGVKPVALLHQAGLLSPRALLAHANYVDAGDLAMIARSGAHVVYCPRTHAAFGHPPHPVRDLLAAGINVALGTDSLGSNPDLSLRAEMRFLLKCRRDVPVSTLLRMATRGGAQALGFTARCGRLQAGMRADVCVLSGAGLDAVPTANADGICEAIIAGDEPPIAVFVGGERIAGSQAPTPSG